MNTDRHKFVSGGRCEVEAFLPDATRWQQVPQLVVTRKATISFRTLGPWMESIHQNKLSERPGLVLISAAREMRRGGEELRSDISEPQSTDVDTDSLGLLADFEQSS